MAVAILVLVGCAAIVDVHAHRNGSSSLPQLRLAGDRSQKFGISQVYDPNPAGTSFGAIPICMTKPGTGTVTGVKPHGGNGGLRVAAFAVRLHTSAGGLGASDKSLQSEGFPTTANSSTTCGSTTADELGITVQRTSTGNGRFTSLAVLYVSAGKRFSFDIPMALKLCGPEAKTNYACGDAYTP